MFTAKMVYLKKLKVQKLRKRALKNPRVLLVFQAFKQDAEVVALFMGDSLTLATP